MIISIYGEKLLMLLNKTNNNRLPKTFTSVQTKGRQVKHIQRLAIMPNEEVWTYPIIAYCFILLFNRHLCNDAINKSDYTASNTMADVKFAVYVS
jgi:hypothetical protein